MKTQDLAYVLHRRPYRDNSLLVDFFTQHHGVVTAVCRGARQSKKNISLEGFIPFWIEYGSKNSLATLYQWEPDLTLSSQRLNLTGTQLYCGLYVNELLAKLLGRHDPYPELFLFYQCTLNGLQSTDNIEKTLREFEFYLLKEIGYGIPLQKEINTDKVIMEQNNYYYNPGVGFSLIRENSASSKHAFIFEGKTLLALAKSNFSQAETLKDGKRLMRLTLDFLLEKHGKLKSRELFVK